ncbi:MAG: hypothetical protein ABSD56_01630 [Bryobacteraceae bacterium]|jgi:hypothetical protein
MALVLNLGERPDQRHPIVLSSDIPRDLGAGEPLELADRATIEALRLLFRERHDTAQTGAKD